MAVCEQIVVPFSGGWFAGRWYLTWASLTVDMGRTHGWNLYLRLWPRPRLGLVLRPKGWQISVWPFAHAYVARVTDDAFVKVWGRSK